MRNGTTERRGVGQGRQWTEEQARETLEDLAESGESAAVFARRKGLSPRRIAYWKKRIGSRARTEFVAVALPEAPRASIEIGAGSIVIRVREDLDVEHVARLVEAIGRRRGGAC
jgi:hypothetical protein